MEPGPACLSSRVAQRGRFLARTSLDKGLGSAREREIMLGVLNAVDRDHKVSQRRISSEVGIALGLVNAYLKRCVRKGLIKVSQVPLNRYAYYLTPAGFAEKGRLTVEYLQSSLEFFRNARQQCTALFEAATRHGRTQLILVGDSELAEAAILSARETGVRILAVVEAAPRRENCGGTPVVSTLEAALALAAPGRRVGVLVTDMARPQAVFDDVLDALPGTAMAPEDVFTLPLLGISRRPGSDQGAGT